MAVSCLQTATDCGLLADRRRCSCWGNSQARATLQLTKRSTSADARSRSDRGDYHTTAALNVIANDVSGTPSALRFRIRRRYGFQSGASESGQAKSYVPAMGDVRTSIPGIASPMGVRRVQLEYAVLRVVAPNMEEHVKAFFLSLLLPP